MNITVTLEQAKRLEEMGAPQDTYLAWWKGKFGDWGIYIRNMYPMQPVEQIAAHTLSELIDWLGDNWQDMGRWLSRPGYFAAGHKPGSTDLIVLDGATPLDAVYNLCCAVKGGDRE